MMVLTLSPTTSGVNVLFTHDTDVSLTMAAALVSTTGTDDHDDALTTVDHLRAFLHGWGDTGTAAVDAAALHDVRALRRSLRAVWGTGEDEVVAAVNALLEGGRALPRLVRHDGYGWHVHATPDDAPPAVRLGVETAMALVDLVRAGALDRLGSCAREGCDDVLVDLSRNRSRRYCDKGCADRDHAAAYRSRRAAQGAVAQDG